MQASREDRVRRHGGSAAAQRGSRSRRCGGSPVHAASACEAEQTRGSVR